MASPGRRLWPVALVAFLIAIGPGLQLPWITVSLPGGQVLGAATAAPPQGSTSNPTSLGAIASVDLETEPAGQPEGTLPLPSSAEPPDGTLKLPPSGAESPEMLGPGTDDAAIAAEDTAPSVETVPVSEVLGELDPAAARRSRLLIKADRLYRQGNLAAAEPFYRQAKASKWDATPVAVTTPAPITDAAALTPGAAAYWREALAGQATGLDTRLRIPLEQLVETYPEFIPAQVLYTDYWLGKGDIAQAEAVINRAIHRYPSHPNLLQAQTRVLMAQEKWMEAAISARQVALLDPRHPDRSAMEALSEANLNRFRQDMNQALTGNLLTNIVTGVGGYLLTGGLFGPFTAINSTAVLLQGEQSLGEQIAQQATAQLPMMEDPAVLAYVNRVGESMAALAGRDEFDYQFYVVMDDELNAFALPGGKIFVNAGALMNTASEAELAGLLGHEVAHAVLSHGFQMVTQGNLTSSLAVLIPIPEVASIAANLALSSYSRDMERQADVLGTQILGARGYAADGLHNLMVTLKQTTQRRGVSWFASHPAPEQRVSDLKQLIDQGGYTRYAYEGVAQHLQMRHRVHQLMEQFNAAEDPDSPQEEPGPNPGG